MLPSSPILSSAKPLNERKSVAMDEDMMFKRELVSLYFSWRYGQGKAFPIGSKMSIAEYISRYGEIASGCQIEDVYVKLIGRARCDQPLLSSDSSSPHVIFHLHWDDAEVDVVADARKLKMDAVYFSKLYSYMRTGIAVAVSGYPGKNESGDLYVLAAEIDFSLMAATQKPRVANAAVVADAAVMDAAVVKKADGDAVGTSGHFSDRKGIGNKKVYRIRSKFIKSMKKFLHKSEFMKVKTLNLNMWSCMNPDPKFWFLRLLLGTERTYGAGNHFRNLRRTGLTQEPKFIGCEFFKSFKYDALVELIEQMLSSIIRKLTGDYKIKYHANGSDKDPIEIDFHLPFRRINMIEELEKTANLNIPEDLSSESANVYLSDACTKYGLECPPPRTTAQLLNKLVEKFVEVDCINPTFLVNHPNLKLSCMGDAGLTDDFELFINKREVCSGCVVLEDPKVPRRMTFPRQFKKQAPSTSLGYRVELGRTGWWLWSIDWIVMLLADSQDIEEVNCSKFMGHTHKKKKRTR